MKNLILILLFVSPLFLACGPKNYQPPTDQANCDDACGHLRDLGCEEGNPLEDGTTCEEFCKANLDAGHSLNPTCVMQIQSCEDMEEMKMQVCEEGKAPASEEDADTPVEEAPAEESAPAPEEAPEEAAEPPVEEAPVEETPAEEVPATE